MSELLNPDHKKSLQVVFSVILSTSGWMHQYEEYNK